MPNYSEYYMVQPGDSMWKIAADYGIALSELIDANPEITNPSLIYPNQRIRVPSRVTQPGVTEPVPLPGYPEPGNPLPGMPEPEVPQTNNLEEQVANLVNVERERNGLSPLTFNADLTEIARIKSEDMERNNYFSHQSPTYGSPFDMLRSYGVSFTAAGENIAYGQRTAQSVMDAWMNSPGHRANILSRDFTQIGVGYTNNRNTPYWTQLFTRP